MSEIAFFRRAEPLPLTRIAAMVEAKVPEGVDPDRLFLAVAPLDHAGPDDVAVFTDAADPDDLRTTRAGACLVAAADLGEVPPNTIALLADRPSDAFHKVAAVLHPRSTRPEPIFERGGIDPAATVHADAILEQGVIVDPGVVVGPRVEIGAGTTIGANSVIGAGVRIGRGCSIDSHVSIRAALIGDRVIIHAGARIGFGATEPRAVGPTPCLGRVIIQNDVEIGANAAVERGRLRDTTIGEGAREGVFAVVRAETTLDRCEALEAGAFSSAEKMV